jgi:putative Mg2+ transporter-C (MgtC) family protein
MNYFTPDVQHLLIALLIGTIIGSEREYRSKSAGLRTMILVCMGSCLFTILSIHIGLSNPDRIAANIITGIGFLGAGVIFKDENRVTGITTATTIWMVASLGMAVGGGYELLAFIGTGIIMIVLIGLLYLQYLIADANELRDYKIKCAFQQETLVRYEKLFKEYHLKAIRGKQSKTEDTITGYWTVQGSKKNHESLIDCLLNDPEIKEFDF